MYPQTLQNVKNDDPDFYIDLGDTFAMDPSPLGTGMTDAEARAAYYVQRPYMRLITDSIPLFLVLGNHENEEGWNWDDTWPSVPTDKSLALVGMTARKLYFPNPIPDDFYSGNTDPLPSARHFADATGSIYHEDYYAWTWGDALFVVLDPYHYSMTWPSEGGTYGGEGQDGEVGGTRWDWTLGKQQYDWLAQTLKNSTAKYKFVFSHHEVGGDNPYGRGGIKSAGYYEWGGKNADGTWGFGTHRPGWGVDATHPEGTPIHQLMVENGVTAYFHGHDHAYAYEKLDGVVYQECPKPDEADPAQTSYLVESAADGGDHYPSAVKLPASGHLRVTVSPTTGVTVDYVKTYLPGNGTNGEIARSYTIPAEVVTHTLTYTAGAHGSLSGISPQTVADGDDGTQVEAIPDSGYHFVNWSDGSTANPRTDTNVTADVSVTAQFAVGVVPHVVLDGTPTSGTGAANATSLSFAHTTGTGSDRLLLVGVSWNCGSTDRGISSVTFTPSGGSAIPLTEVFTQIAGSSSSGGRYSAIYRLLDPPSGVTGTVTATFSGAVQYGSVAGAADFAGVDQTTPLGAPGGGASTSGSAPTVTLTGLNGSELVFDNVFQGAAGGAQTLTPGAGQTSRWNTSSSGTCAAASTKQATGGSVTMSWTATPGASYWAIAAVPINPAATGPALSSIAVSAPAATASVARGGELAVSWAPDAAVAAPAQFGVWLVKGGVWSLAAVYDADDSASYTRQVPVNVPVDTGYQVYVYYRATSGAAWSVGGLAAGALDVSASVFSASPSAPRPPRPASPGAASSRSAGRPTWPSPPRPSSASGWSRPASGRWPPSTTPTAAPATPPGAGQRARRHRLPGLRLLPRHAAATPGASAASPPARST